MTYRYCQPCEERGKTTEATDSSMSPVAGRTLCCAPCKRKEAPIAAAIELGAKSIPVNVPCRKSSPTSQAGARRASINAGSQAYRCLEVIAAEPKGLMREEVIALVGLRESAACGRLNSIGKGKDGDGLHYIFERGLRESSSGVMVTVYHATDRGRAFLAASKLGRAA